MKVPTIHEVPVRNLRAGEPCDPSVAHVHPSTGQLLCECSEGLHYCALGSAENQDGSFTCPDCGAVYEIVGGDEMAKASKKKAPKKQNGEKLPRAVAKVDLLTGEKIDFRKPKKSAKTARPEPEEPSNAPALEDFEENDDPEDDSDDGIIDA